VWNYVAHPKRKTQTKSHPKRETQTISHPKRKTQTMSHPKRKTQTTSHPKRKTQTMSHPMRKTQAMSENKMPRIIFEPTREEVTVDWRCLHNQDLLNLYSSPNRGRILGGYTGARPFRYARTLHRLPPFLAGQLRRWWDCSNIVEASLLTYVTCKAGNIPHSLGYTPHASE
jgi:hypothetical protein